jgi:hypothetical protein
MSAWMQRAKACFAQKGQVGTDKTDETPLLSVLAVPPGAIFEKSQLASDLIEAAMRRCDEFNDSDQAREEMRQQCMALSPAMQQDLLDHFNGKPVQFD